MHIAVALNVQGGTLKTLDLDALEAKLHEALEAQGHSVAVTRLEGSELIETLQAMIADKKVDAIMVGGGDGTVSAAAGIVQGTQKSLAILPAGTMNLFARSLSIPLDLEEAIDALAAGRTRDVDVASANGRFFVHQFSIGLHAELIKMRDKQEFKSRLGKMRASVVAAAKAVVEPPRITLQLDVDGDRLTVGSQSLGVTNNLFGEGHLPYADEPDRGELGVYIAKARKRSDLFKFLLELGIGRWRSSAHLDILTAQEVRVAVTRKRRTFACAIDGELCELEEETVLRIHPGALKVIVPASAG